MQNTQKHILPKAVGTNLKMELRKTLKKYVIEKYLELEYIDSSSYGANKFTLKDKLIEDLTSGNESRVLGAAKIARSLDNLNLSKSELDRIKKATSNLPKSDICRMYDYRLDINEGIEILENFTNGKSCKCNLYENHQRLSPESQLEMGLVTLEKEPFLNKEKYQYEFDLVCTSCGTRWFTFEQHSYHYPWSKWKKK